MDAGWLCCPRHFVHSVIVFVASHAEAMDDNSTCELDKSARPDEPRKTDKQSSHQAWHALAIFFFYLYGMGKNGHVDNENANNQKKNNRTRFEPDSRRPWPMIEKNKWDQCDIHRFDPTLL